MRLEVEMALEVKITWEKDVDNQDGGSTRGQHVAAVFGTFRTQFESLYHGRNRNIRYE